MAWRHGEEAAVHKPRRGAQDASPLGLRRTQPCRHPSSEPPASRAARDGSSAVLRPVCRSLLWGPQEGHTASWGCGHRSTVSDPHVPQPAWPPASQESLFSSPLFVPADTSGTQEANEGQVPEQRSSLRKVWPNLHTSGTFFPKIPNSRAID